MLRNMQFYFIRLIVLCVLLLFFFFNDTATTEIYTLSLHDALPICQACGNTTCWRSALPVAHRRADRKSTRLNSSHLVISYAVFCLKKKNKKMKSQHHKTKKYNTKNENK